ncbi:hypothetical protein AUJ84_01330 [Candidatus Pacearchaeota archaeon CG1_02_32_132]|nr:MAG: hypothetical protein AUJ84_01330 [Candidatus Pacearchaeota archaeon CG1_02_32_132]
MTGEILTEVLNKLGPNFGIPIWLIVIVLIWSIIWKGLALWKSARKNQSIWFIIILILNTVGILEILYLFLFSKIELPNVKEKSKGSEKKKKQEII